MRARRAVGGFTLLEIVIAIAILSILVVMATPVIRLDVQRQRETELRQALRDIRTALDAYKHATDEGRIVRKADESGYPHNLEELTQGVPNARDPKGRLLIFLRHLPRDPLRHEPGLAAADTWGKRSYESTEDAPAEGADVFDVYSLAEGVGINGIAYRKW
jgi:general secretion pathway protein G